SFFFQAEDGIRDFHVTGVQTCALPIYASPATISHQRGAASKQAGFAGFYARIMSRLIENGRRRHAFYAAVVGLLFLSVGLLFVRDRKSVVQGKTEARCGGCASGRRRRT